MNLFFGHTENNEGMSKVTTHVDTKIKNVLYIKSLLRKILALHRPAQRLIL